MLDLRQLYSILDWSFNQRDREPGKSICIAIIPPSDISAQYPSDGKEGEDSSPHHITVGYLGQIPLELEHKVVTILQSVAERTKAFPIRISKIGMFENEEHTVYHSTIKSRRLSRFHDDLKAAFSLAQMPMDATHPDYTPHITIEYVPIDSEPQYVPEIPPQGEWVADSVWLWGFEQPHMIFLK